MSAPGKSAWVAVAAALWWTPLVSSQTVVLDTSELPPAVKGEPYDVPVQTAVTGRCEHSDAKLAVVQGRLPAGLRVGLESISGIPREVGEFDFSMSAANGCASDVKPLHLLVTGRAILNVRPEEIVVEVREGDATTHVQTALVTGTWPGLAYSLSRSPQTWLKVEPEEGRIPDRDSAFSGDRLKLKFNAAKLAPGTYQESIRLSAWDATNAPMIRVVLRIQPQ